MASRTSKAPARTKEQPAPGHDHAALADLLTQHLGGGALVRRLHPDRTGHTG